MNVHCARFGKGKAFEGGKDTWLFGVDCCISYILGQTESSCWLMSTSSRRLSI